MWGNQDNLVMGTGKIQTNQDAHYKLSIYITIVNTTSITSFIALTLWFGWWFFLLIWLPPDLTWGIVHEALNHVGSDQSEPTKCPMLHHKQH